MLTSFLKSLGMQTGWSRGHDEAYFFHKLNLYMERVCNCGWDNPKPLLGLNSCPAKKDEVIRYLRSSLEWPKSAAFFGPMGFIRKQSVAELTGAWGWKDPRNTFTAPIWQEIFPEIKFVHIYRNGVDVAASLRDREINHPPKVDSIYSSPRVCTLEGGFSLWEEYIEQAFSIQPDVGRDGILHIRFEDFMSTPYETLNSIVTFCNLEPDREILEQAAKSADPERSYAFRVNKELNIFYKRISGSHWMKKLGYSSVD